MDPTKEAVQVLSSILNNSKSNEVFETEEFKNEVKNRLPVVLNQSLNLETGPSSSRPFPLFFAD
jgi:hypothetical protein